MNSELVRLTLYYLERKRILVPWKANSMLAVPPVTSGIETMADVLHRLGDISPKRVRLRPFPASAADVVEIERCENRLFELVDGALVEKVMGHPESRIASAIIIAIGIYLEENDIGTVSGEGGMFRLPDNLVRIPDVAFARWERFPDEESIEASVPEVTPDLAVEVLSEGNTRGEMSRKLREYFSAGVPLVWFVDPPTQSVTIYSSPTRSKVVPLEGTLEGGKVLPGFRLPVAKIFARLKRARIPKRKDR